MKIAEYTLIDCATGQDPALRLSFYCKRYIRILFAE